MISLSRKHRSKVRMEWWVYRSRTRTL